MAPHAHSSQVQQNERVRPHAPCEADDIRVLAGMMHQVAEQVEPLASIVRDDTAPLADSDGSDT